MKILHVVRQFHPMVGGIENYVLHLAKSQLENGHEVSVVTLNRNFLTGEKLPSTGMLYGSLRIIRIPYFGSHKYPFAFQVFKHLGGAEVINIHAVDFFADAFAFASFFLKKKLILTTHGGFFHTSWGSTLKKIFFNIVTRLTVTRYHQVIACSTNDQQIFSRLTKNIVTIENGVDVQSYINQAKKREPGLLVYVGRIDSHKRVDRLIEAVHQLKTTGVNVRLEVVGPDWKQLVPGLKDLCTRLNVDDRVRFLGAVDDSLLKERLSAADIFLSASEYEGFGISAVEALASGTLCALNNIESFRKILENKSFGLIIDFNDAKEATKKLIKLINKPEQEYNLLSTKARSYAQLYDWKEVTKKIDYYYKN